MVHFLCMVSIAVLLMMPPSYTVHPTMHEGKNRKIPSLALCQLHIFLLCVEQIDGKISYKCNSTTPTLPSWKLSFMGMRPSNSAFAGEQFYGGWLSNLCVCSVVNTKSHPRTGAARYKTGIHRYIMWIGISRSALFIPRPSMPLLWECWFITKNINNNKNLLKTYTQR